MKKLINKDLIATLKPCKDRFDNYVKYYESKSFTKGQFMGLKNITQQDKLWVAFRLMPKDNIRLASADIAESVLHIFEEQYPNDKRPRLAIESARRGNDKEAYAAYAAASNAAYTCAYAANDYYPAANAAADAAYAAANAAADAAYAAANAVDAAAYSSAANDKSKQEKLIRKIVLKYWR